MNRVIRNILTGAVLVGACLCGQNLLAQTLVVGTCTGSPNSYATIQDAVNNAPSGATVLVCPGKYPEQVEISEPLTLTGIQSANDDAAVITAPAGVLEDAQFPSAMSSAAAQIWVHDTTGVTVSNLTVDGAGSGISTNGSCEALVGILLQDASGTVKNVLTRNQLTGGCRSGFGAVVFSESGLNSTVTVKDSSFRSFDGLGFWAQGKGTNVTFQSNTVEDLGQGQGVNEVEYDFARGSIDGNSVVDALTEGSGAFNIDTASCGIALGQYTGPVTISGNAVGNTDCGVGLYNASGNTISSNIIFGTQGTDGVFVCGNGNTVIDNTISDSHQAGVELSCQALLSLFPSATANNNDVSKNTINGATFGVSIQPGATGDVTKSDKVFNVTHVNATQ